MANFGGMFKTVICKYTASILGANQKWVKIFCPKKYNPISQIGGSKMVKDRPIRNERKYKDATFGMRKDK